MKKIILLFLLLIYFSNNYAQNTVKDIDGNTYNTVTLGSQKWMKENLKSTKYNDGTSISLVNSVSNWEDLKTAAYCFYDCDETNKNKYGALYNFYAVETNKLCPTGWHIPSNGEWLTLHNHLRDIGYGYEGTGDDIGKSLAAAYGWKTSNTPGYVGNTQSSNNKSGFSALPSGFRNSSGGFCGEYIWAYWWCSNKISENRIWVFSMSYEKEGLARMLVEDSYFRNRGYAVRCVQD